MAPNGVWPSPGTSFGAISYLSGHCSTHSPLADTLLQEAEGCTSSADVGTQLHYQDPPEDACPVDLQMLLGEIVESSIGLQRHLSISVCGPSMRGHMAAGQQQQLSSIHPPQQPTAAAQHGTQMCLLHVLPKAGSMVEENDGSRTSPVTDSTIEAEKPCILCPHPTLGGLVAGSTTAAAAAPPYSAAQVMKPERQLLASSSCHGEVGYVTPAAMPAETAPPPLPPRRTALQQTYWL